MSTNYLIQFGASALKPSDAANTPSAVVERDASGNIAVSAVGATQLSSSGPIIGSTVTTFTTTATVANEGVVYRLNATGGAFTTTLPPAASSTGRFLYFFKSDSSGNLPTLKGNASENINGANTYTSLSAQYNHVLLWCDGTQWWTVG